MSERRRYPIARTFYRLVQKKEERKLRARSQRRELWFGLGMFGVVGWSVAIPTLIGVALGQWLDQRFPSEISWTLTLLMAGVFLGSVNAWRWTEQHRCGTVNQQVDPEEVDKEKIDG